MVMNTDPLHDSEDEDMADENARRDLRELASHLLNLRQTLFH